jgi:lipoprotein-releasing system permease protein
VLIGLRYTRAKRRNHFISFISLISMLGIGLGVAALIVVLSVMNGFQKELRTRILGVASHIQITGINGELATGRRWPRRRAKHPGSAGDGALRPVAGMFTYDGSVKGAMVRGILPDRKTASPIFARHIKSGSLTTCVPANSASCWAPIWRVRCASLPATR